MDVSTSEYGSGCASGWTMYLDPFPSSTPQWDTSLPFDNHDYQSKGAHANQEYEDEDEDEDLSMVSDASSGPPHFHQDEEVSTQEITISKSSKNCRKKAKESSRRNFQDFHLLDDTASSKAPQYNAHVHSHHNSDKYFLGHDSSLSQGFSATHCKGKSALKKHFGFFKSSRTGKLAD